MLLFLSPCRYSLALLFKLRYHRRLGFGHWLSPFWSWLSLALSDIVAASRPHQKPPLQPPQYQNLDKDELDESEKLVKILRCWGRTSTWNAFFLLWREEAEMVQAGRQTRWGRHGSCMKSSLYLQLINTSLWHADCHKVATAGLWVLYRCVYTDRLWECLVLVWLWQCWGDSSTSR